jgi:hypothetical protein
MRLANIQDGGGRHLKKQNYMITTIFIGRSGSSFVGRTAFTLGMQLKKKSEIGKIQHGGGRHLEKASTS